MSVLPSQLPSTTRNTPRVIVPTKPIFRSLQLVQSPQRLRRLVTALLLILLAAGTGVCFAPWQQNARASGQVVAYLPMERRQTLEAPIYGRVVRWGEGIREGAVVKKGQFLLEIQDNDPLKAERLTGQLEASRLKRELAVSKAETYGRQVLDLEEAKKNVNDANSQLVEEARRKVQAAKFDLEAAEAEVRQTFSNFQRQQKLFDSGFTSGTSFEKERLAYEKAQAKRDSSQQYIEAAELYLKSKSAEMEQKSREAQVKIDYARASQQDAKGEAALASKDVLEAEGKASQFASREIEAPLNGVIFRIHANSGAEMLKEGTPLMTIVPETEDRAVELYVIGNDLPLVHVGREVRLQFEGWPAFQFAAGWPHLAVGTFGGEVVTVDATDDGTGKFRILVKPRAEDTWPPEDYLRQGVRANGWVLLNEVSLGYEFWRQINGFPAIYGQSDKSSDKEIKKPKLPK